MKYFEFFSGTYRQRREDKKAVMSPRISEIELATLREIPRGNFVQSNALYDPLTLQSINHQDDDALLPKIKREQIILTKFLGSGAFGEVCSFQIKQDIKKCFNISLIITIIIIRQER